MGSELKAVGQFGRAQFVESAERRFPGVCVQGDTLYLWLREIAEVLAGPSATDREQLFWLGRELHEVVVGYVEFCVAEQKGLPSRATGNPQGQWAADDLARATDAASGLRPGQSGYFDLPAGSTSVVHMPDGSTVAATQFWVRNNGTGTWHGYPLP